MHVSASATYACPLFCPDSPGGFNVVELSTNAAIRFSLVRRGRDFTPLPSLPLPGALRQQRKILRRAAATSGSRGVVRHAFECPARAFFETTRDHAALRRRLPRASRLPAALRRRLATGPYHRPLLCAAGFSETLTALLPLRRRLSLHRPLLCAAGFVGSLRRRLLASARRSNLPPLLRAAGFLRFLPPSLRAAGIRDHEGRLGPGPLTGAHPLLVPSELEATLRRSTVREDSARTPARPGARPSMRPPLAHRP
jgi:hypothetical protein